MKLLQRISFIILITFFNANSLSAQCSYDNFISLDVDMPDNYTLAWQNTSGNVYRFPVTLGTTYEWSLSVDEGAFNGDPSNSASPRCLALSDVDQGNPIDFYNESIGSDNRSKISWTANYTGTIYVQAFSLQSFVAFSQVAFRAYKCSSISNLVLSTLDGINTFCSGQTQVLYYQYYIPDAYFKWVVNGVESSLHDSAFTVYESANINMEISLPNTSCAVYTNDISIVEENVFITSSDSNTRLCNFETDPPTPPVTKTLFANSNGLEGTYQWFKDGQALATTSSIVINQSGLYKVKRIAGPLPCIAEDSIQIQIGTVPPTPNINIITNDTICNGGQAQFEVSNLVGNNLTYIWQLNGAAIPASNFSNYITSNQGTYSLVLSDAVGCLSASSNSLTITTIDCTGFETLQAADIVLYPNPANQFLNLTMPSNYQEVAIAVFDMQGRKLNINVAPSSNGIYQIPLQDVAIGLYQITINTSSKLISKRFVKIN